MLREMNDRAAIDALLRVGPSTRSELKYAIGLSKPATSQLLAHLETEGVVVKAGVRGGGRGPRAQLWTVNGGLVHVAAVDLTPHVADFVVADITGAILAEPPRAAPRARRRRRGRLLRHRARPRSEGGRPAARRPASRGHRRARCL